jgi:hypothetical protein
MWRLEAWVPRLSVLGGAWMLGNSLRSCQKLREMQFPQTAPIAGGQNSSSIFISRVGTTCLGFGVIGEEKRKTTSDLPWFGQYGLRPRSLFLFIFCHSLQ